MKKQFVILTLAAMMAATSIPAMASAETKSDTCDPIVVECTTEDWEEIDYLDMLEEDKEFISDAQYNELKGLFKELEAAEEKGSEEEIERLWNQIDGIYDDAFGAEEDLDGEFSADDLYEELEFYKAFISADDYNTLKDLFDKVIPLEEDEDYDEADKIWEKIDEILDDCGYYDDEEYEDFEFDEDLAFLKEIVSKDDYTKLAKLYDELEPLEEAEKYDEADVLWEQVDIILGAYEDTFEELFGDEFEGYDDLETPAFYNVVDGELQLSKNPDDYANSEIPDASGEDKALYEKLWERVKLIVPDEYLKMITSFDLSTNGFGGMAASVAPVDEQEKQWIFNYDPEDAVDEGGRYDQQLIDETMIHEFGHILTLNHTQISDPVENSDNYTTDEGTLKRDSYLNAFYQAFWKDIADKYRVDEGDGGEYYDVDRLYEDMEEEFVTDYAATNPAEDIAESFAFFVTGDKPKDADGANEKILFFYAFPELVQMRTEIRSNLNMN